MTSHSLVNTLHIVCVHSNNPIYIRIYIKINQAATSYYNRRSLVHVIIIMALMPLR